MRKKEDSKKKVSNLHGFTNVGAVKKITPSSGGGLISKARPAPSIRNEPNTSNNGKYIVGVGLKVGINKDSSKWRCKICKFLNDNDSESCQMCRESKQALNEDQKRIVHYNSKKPKAYQSPNPSTITKSGPKYVGSSKMSTHSGSTNARIHSHTQHKPLSSHTAHYSPNADHRSKPKQAGGGLGSLGINGHGYSSPSQSLSHPKEETKIPKSSYHRPTHNGNTHSIRTSIPSSSSASPSATNSGFSAIGAIPTTIQGNMMGVMGGKVNTLADVRGNPQNLSKPKVPRKMKETQEQVLKVLFF